MDSEKPQKVGNGTVVIALVVVGLVGLGAGYAFSMISLPNSPVVPVADAAKPAATTGVNPGAEASKAESKESGAAKSSEVSKTNDDPKAVAGTDIPTMPDPVDESVNLKDYVLGPLPPVVTNLAQPNNVWIRLDGFLVIKKSPEIKAVDIGQQIAPFVLSYLKTLKATDLQGSNGLSALNNDLNEIVRTASNGDVHSVLLTGFIIE